MTQQSCYPLCGWEEMVGTTVTVRVLTFGRPVERYVVHDSIGISPGSIQ
jgi:hypothetical protein